MKSKGASRCTYASEECQDAKGLMPGLKCRPWTRLLRAYCWTDQTGQQVTAIHVLN